MDPVRNSMAPVFGARPSITARPSWAVRNSLARGSLANRMSLLPGNSKRLPPAIMSGKTVTIRDTRNLTVKSVTTEMVHKMIRFFGEFEEEGGVSFAYNEKVIREMRKADFRTFFEFIFRRLDDHYRLDAMAVEDEVPKLLTALGYPYPIKKSTLSTMGAPHSWPYVIGVLDWLIELVYKDEQIKEESLVDELAYSYFKTCYKKKMEQPEEEVLDFTDEINAYRELLSPESVDMDKKMDELKERRLNNEKAMLQIKDDVVKDQEEIREIEADIGDLRTDIKDMKKHNEEVLVQHSRIDENITSKEVGIQKLSETLNTKMEENQRKEMQIASQKMSGTEAKQLMSHRNALREQIASKRDEFSKCDEKLYVIRPQCSKLSRDV
ncbi:HEC/Ndc80p family domain-containing protein [Ditylenchus destructor]|uniref:Kinetochore protein NDC80 n=1 Tax=Ditylenchus destructor TaxID=166010 RepID=A0AAD4R3D3_9BILA|nr:HEC/Ndc80p family domain-containing protein [Ditylenchus destructor]